MSASVKAKKAKNILIMGDNWAYFDSLSTTTKMTDFSLDFGKPVMKSITISSHMTFDICNGCNNPAGFLLSYFAC